MQQGHEDSCRKKQNYIPKIDEKLSRDNRVNTDYHGWSRREHGDLIEAKNIVLNFEATRLQC